MKTVTLIIPIFNTGEKLYRCLESVKSQTFADFECLMIDDGSKDESPQIIEEYAQKDSRFKAIHKENGGVSSARNEGLKKAKGEWVVFLDSDDSIKPNHLEAMLAAVDSDIDIVFTGYEQTLTGGRIAEGHQYVACKYKEKDGVAKFLSETDTLRYMVPWDRMYRRRVIADAGILFDLNLSLSEDRLFCYQYLLYARGIVTISAVTYMHDASDLNSLSNRFYPFQVNAYRYDTFVKATEELFSRFELSDYAVFEMWKYTWNILVLTLSSLYNIKKNIFKVACRQKDFFHKHFGWNLYAKVKNTSEYEFFSASDDFKIIFDGNFFYWNLQKAKAYLLYKLHISR